MVASSPSISPERDPVLGQGVTFRTANDDPVRTREVIGVDWADTDPNILDPGPVADFDTEVYFWKGKPDKAKVGS
jgi:hypothetical protein